MQNYLFIANLGVDLSLWNIPNKFPVNRSSPSLSFSPRLGLINLSYPGPSNYGQQKFSFDPQLFVSAFNLSKSSGIPFDELFFDEYYPKANKTVRSIFSLFLINPTVIRKTVRLNTSIHRKLPLAPSKVAILAFLDIPRHRSAPNLNPNNNRVSVYSFPFLDDPVLIGIVRKTALLCDFNLFDEYLSAYSQIVAKNGLKMPQNAKFVSRLFKKFANQVHSMQKS